MYNEAVVDDTNVWYVLVELDKTIARLRKMGKPKVSGARLSYLYKVMYLIV